jgi:hypothetical protein
MSAMRTEQAQYKNQEQPKFYCSACGNDRYCDCSAPALERLAAITEKSRHREREKKQRQRERQKLNGNNDPSPGDIEDGIRAKADDRPPRDPKKPSIAPEIVNQLIDCTKAAGNIRTWIGRHQGELEPSDTAYLAERALAAASEFQALASAIKAIPVHHGGNGADHDRWIEGDRI